MSIPFHERMELARLRVAHHPAQQPVQRIERQRLADASKILDEYRERVRRIVAAHAGAKV